MEQVDGNRAKKAAEWFYSTVFRDEAIRQRDVQSTERIPSLIRTARSLASGSGTAWQSRESVFLKQAKLLANYEDDYTFQGSVVRYYPTYQSLTDQELRGYFSWRTKLRRGNVQKTCLTFAFLYIYEMINQIGVADPSDGYQKLCAFRDTYGQADERILPYLGRWMTDYVVYYGLDASVLAGLPQVVFDRSITVLEHVQQQDTAKVLYAVKQLSPQWLERSKFYKAYPADCDTVIHRVLCRVDQHCATRCKRSFTEQYFGTCRQFQTRLFETAVFCDVLKRRNWEYAVDERCIYRCRNGLWTVTMLPVSQQSNGKLKDLLKTIDAVMREEYAYRYPVKYETETKWLLKLIREEVQTLLAAKKAAAAKKITIDYSQLEKIRREAAITQDKLTVEEELEEIEEAQICQEPAAKETAPVCNAGESPDSPLSSAEYRLLQSLLYGGSTDWIRQEGLLLSVLLDSINEKLYDEFLDAVLDDGPAVCEDYIDALKEMIKP